ncbi:phenoloxidase-activating factor 1-like [Macrobrachium rosenbergii]|uniref:phenoloxidase-activating factor 1-like n=1 Tax=Macrobrachium rosenbergii TaxID=79674 RepID=UPI0034D42903
MTRTSVPWKFLCAVGLALFIEGVASQSNPCPQECVSLQDCPELAKLLRDPTLASIKRLQEATCFISGTVPKVCCPQPKASKVSLLPRNCGQGPSIRRIVGGESTSPGDFPWMAVFGYKEIGFDGIKYLCGGSVINERYVLTAAHCVTPELLSVQPLEVIQLGDWDLKQFGRDCQGSFSGEICADPSVNVTYEKIIIHPNYSKRGYQSDDIALVRLSKKIDISGVYIHPVCLPPQGLSARSAMARPDLLRPEAVVTGWGITEKGVGSDRLLRVTVPYVEKSDCNSTYRGNIVEEQICMGGEIGKDSCSGDSGGPLVLGGPRGPPYLQIGVVSYGPTDCGQNGIPGIYTDVTFYRNWIEETLQP